MKKYSHAWIAFMAIKRLEVIATTDNEAVVKGVSEDVRKEAKALVRWFKNYRDFVIQGAWYPDEVFKDMSTSHIVKYRPSDDGPYTTFGKLPSPHTIYEKMRKSSPLFNKPYAFDSGNCADRCESISHSIVDNFKMLHREDRGCPIATTGNHIAMRFFILSHYVADCHMPLHCDARPFSDEKGIHGAIEKKWEDQVNKSYKIDKDNNRFFYDPDGYPLPLNPTPFVLDVENDVATRKYIHGWGGDNGNTWDFMSAVSQYSYLFSYYLIPETFKNTQTMQEFMEQTVWGQDFDKYSKMIFGDAIDSIARIWLRVWIKYRKWLK
ncbi:MAG: hypothetical protein II899_12295 [Bacteroidales bacterium]|nr:hypothetical protein [Bacteroidales bacterium]